MDVLLDETTLHPCAPERLPVAPAHRILALAETLKALDGLGLPRALRCVRDAPDRDLGDGRGLRSWCSDRTLERDARVLILSRLGKQPFIDGPDGLFCRREGAGVIEGRCDGILVYGLGLAALGGGIAVGLHCEPPAEEPVAVIVELASLEAEALVVETFAVSRFVSAGQVYAASEMLRSQVLRDVGSGAELLERVAALFPHLRLGPRAIEQIAALSGREPVFGSVLRHLGALDQGARQWAKSAAYCPAGGVNWSLESETTLKHGRHGPLRDFPVPAGFAQERFSCHTKLGTGWRLYFRPERAATGPLVLIGYLGPHLPTARFDG